MYLSHQLQHKGSNASKFALVAGLHALVAVGVINMMNGRVIPLPPLPGPVILVPTPKPMEPLTPIDPPKPAQQMPPPPISVPKVEIDIAPPQVENPVHATVQAEPVTEQRTVTPPGPQQEQQVAKPASNSGAMHRAVLADANSCAKPNYPVQSARNGDSGTVVLALLVGTDGRVTDARIQKSSGYRELDRAAVNALSLCQFMPALNNGVPEAGWGQIAYVWSLE